jgi:CSLREA domain-containing protein
MIARRLALVLACLAAAPAAAATFTVNALGDAGDASPGNGACKVAASAACTLRAAVQEANATPAADTIRFVVGGTLHLGSVLPPVTRTLTVEGPGAASLTLQSDGGCGTDCHFIAAAGTLTLSGLTLAGARLQGALGVYDGAKLVLDGMVLTDNRAGRGGAVESSGEVVARRTLFLRNRATEIGSAIYATGLLASTLLEDSALVENEGVGAAVHSQGSGGFTALNTTWSGNRSSGDAAALVSAGGASSTTTLTHVTVTGNVSPGFGFPILIYTPTAKVRNSLVAGNRTSGGAPALDCDDAAHSQGGNLWGRHGTCDAGALPASDVWGNDTVLDPELAPLADNGGTTPTHRLLAGSPAIDHALGAFCPGADQRGRARLTDGDGDGVAACDAGAYEVPAPAAPCVADGATLCLQGGRFRVTLTWRAGATSGVGHPVPGASTDSGLLWFFAPANWEFLVKVLDGCALGGHWWVFAAATTDVEYTLRVEDTTTGIVREYANPAGRLAAAVGDTEAFAACP